MSRAEKVVSDCLSETGIGRFSSNAASVARVALALAGPGQKNTREFRARIREEYAARHPERGSIFLIFILPVIIAVVSQWIAKWIVDRSASEVVAVTAEASALTEC